MNVAVTLAPVRVTVNVQTRGVPTVRVTPPVQLTVRAEPRITPLAVRVGGAYVLNSNTSAATPAFVFEQATPSSEWSILHNLGSVPASFQVLVGGIPVIADVLEYSAERIVLAFGDASTGVVTLLK